MAQINSEIKKIFINDVQLPLVDGTANFNMGGQERTSVMGSGVRLGSTTANVPGSLALDATYVKNFDIRGIMDVENARIRVIWDRGAQWLMTGADLSTPLEVSAPEGRISANYEGNPWLVTKQ